MYETGPHGEHDSGKARKYQEQAYYTAIATFKNPAANCIQFERGSNMQFKICRTKYKHVVIMKTQDQRTHFLSDVNDKQFMGLASRYYRYLSEMKTPMTPMKGGKKRKFKTCKSKKRKSQNLPHKKKRKNK
mgnify:CR=1 FL=1